MAFSIRLTKEEKELAETYAKVHAISLADAFKTALFDKIEDEYDISLAKSSYKDYIESGKESRPIEELWEEVGI